MADIFDMFSKASNNLPIRLPEYEIKSQTFNSIKKLFNKNLIFQGPKIKVYYGESEKFIMGANFKKFRTSNLVLEISLFFMRPFGLPKTKCSCPKII